jgi:hypothetical protein
VESVQLILLFFLLFVWLPLVEFSIVMLDDDLFPEQKKKINMRVRMALAGI